MDARKKEFIKSIFLRKAKDDDNTQTTAQLINSVIYDTLSGAKFIAELLQNADDSACKQQTEDKAVATFSLLPGGYLLFQHNGKAFDEKDVTAICDAANRNREKIDDINQTGNKGLGFKSVFSIASYVLIRSNGYSFCFNEQYEQWKDKPEAYPWPIIPIVTEDTDVPAQVKNHLNNELTSFIFKIRNQEQLEEIQQSLKEYCQDSKNLLFLRKISHLEFHDLSGRHTQSVTLSITSSTELAVEEKKDFTVKQLSITSTIGHVSSMHQWCKYTVNYTLSEEMKAVANKLPERLKKYKQATQLPITLAVNYNNNEFIRAQSPQVYCFFKTEVNLDFPFVVNADFLLDTSRANWNTDSTAVKWNACFLREIFFRQFEFISYISFNLGIWPYIINMLAIPGKMELGIFKASKPVFEAAFDNAKGQYSVVTNLQENFVLKISSSIVDRLRFIENFGDEPLKKYSASPKNKNKNLMRELGAREFYIDDILSEVKKEAFLASLMDPELNLKFLKYINDLLEHFKKDDASTKKIVDSLNEIPFILISRKKLKKPKEVYLTDSTLKYSVKDLVFISMIHPILMAAKESLKTFFDTFKIKAITFKKIIEEANKDPRYSVPLLAALMKMQASFEKQEWSEAREMKLSTKGGKHLAAGEVYLSRQYTPAFVIEDYLDHLDHVIADEYHVGEEKSDDQKNFLMKLGLNHTLNQSNAKRLFEIVSKSGPDKMFAFTKYLFEEFFNGTIEENQKLFPFLRDLFKENKFLLKASNDSFFVASDCYLSDCYQPDMQLEDIVEEINYVCNEYVDDLLDEHLLLKWREFFIELGVSHRITIEMVENISRPSLTSRYPSEANKYFNLLDSDEDGQPYYLPTAARRYTSQHSISHFFYIKFLEKILDTPLFWRIIANQWEQIKSIQVTYWSQVIGRTVVPSSIEFYVRLYCLKKFNQKPQNLYMPVLKEYFSEDELQGFLVAEMGEAISDEQWQYFKFKTLTMTDCYTLLNRIAKKPVDDLTLAKVAYLYQQMSNLLDKPAQVKQEDVDMEEGEDENKAENKAEMMKPSQLFSHALQFVEASSLHSVGSSNLTLNKPSPRVLMKPKDVGAVQFEQLCHHFSVPIIRDHDLAVSLESKIIDTSLRKRLEDKLLYLALVNAKELQQVALSDDSLKQFLIKHFAEVKLKLEELICWQAATVVVSYQDVIEEKVDNWIEKNVLYIKNDAAGPKASTTMYQHIVRYLNLALSALDLWEILELSIEEIVNKYPICTEHNIKLAKEAMESSRSNVLPVSLSPAVRISSSTNNKRKLVANIKKEQKEEDVLPESKEVKSSEEAEELVLPDNKRLKSDVQLEDDDEEAEAIIEESDHVVSAAIPTSQPVRMFDSDEEDESKVASDLGEGVSSSMPRTTTASVNFNASTQSSSSLSASFAAPLFNGGSSSSYRARAQSTRMIFSSLTKAERVAIGRQGEEFVYNRYVKNYKEKYANYQFVDMPDGFSFSHENFKKEVHWHNKVQESYQPYDFSFFTYIDGALTKTKYLEVKTKAHAGEDIEFSLSINEYNKMLETVGSAQETPKVCYQLFFVRNIDKPGEEEVLELSAKDLTGQNQDVVVSDFKRVVVKNSA